MTGRFDAARAVADAVLFEGYVLYPYRASAPKNQVRWQWGVLFPPAFARADPSERSWNRTECVVDPGSSPRVTIRVRGLQVQRRSVEAILGEHGGRDLVPVSELTVDDVRWVGWDEAVEREIDLPPVTLLPLANARYEERVLVPGGDDDEELRSATGVLCGRLLRRREPLEVVVRVDAEWADGPGALVKLGVVVENVSDAPAALQRDQALGRALIAVHVLLGLDDGTFVSSLDPGPGAVDAVAGCTNDGTFPVLIGDDDRVLLAAPIILYDHPEIAPQSEGDLCDATEIDEILALRILTLTDEEKAEARATDPRAAAIVDRIDDMTPEAMARLHGTMRELRPVPEADQRGDVAPWWEPAADATVDPWTDTVLVDGIEVATGSRVRLRPSRRADAHDMFLRDMVATVAGVFHDVDEELHVAVTVDDDPATEAMLAHGRYLYFHPDEIEPLR